MNTSDHFTVITPEYFLLIALVISLLLLFCMRLGIFELSLKDHQIARGILKSVSIESVKDLINDDGVFSFDLDGFHIKVYSSSLYVDDIKIYCTSLTINSIYDKVEKISNNDEIEKERMIRKDALIRFGGKI